MFFLMRKYLKYLFRKLKNDKFLIYLDVLFFIKQHKNNILSCVSCMMVLFQYLAQSYLLL